MYMTTRAGMSFIMELMEPELSELSALELENLPHKTVSTVPIKSQMSSIIGQIGSEHPELFALEFGKIAESVDCLHCSIYKY